MAASDILDDLGRNTRRFISDYCHWEMSRPLTHNNDDLECLKNQILVYMCQHRYRPNNHQQAGNVNSDQMKPAPPLGLTGLFAGLPREGQFLSLAEYEKQYREDKDKNLLDIMSYTAAYFRVAYKRVIDIVPMSIENLYILRFWKALRDDLEVKIGLVGDKAAENYSRFAVEEPDSQEKRERLVNMKMILWEGQTIIAELEL